jgi:hypothetical protein
VVKLRAAKAAFFRSLFHARFSDADFAIEAQ